MNCEIIAVGTEILLGEIVNTDAQVVSQGLSELGINTFFQTVCGDNPIRLRSAIDIAKTRADIIITTGGLGPTTDDLTKETIAAAFGKKLVLNEESMARIEKRLACRQITQNNKKQAYLPEGCTIFANDWGTAPGCAFFAENKHVLMLPGPPSECTPMFKFCAMPYLQQLQGGALWSSYIKIFGMGESAVENALSAQMNSWQNPTAAPYAKEGESLVRVTAMGATMQEAQELAKPAVAELCAILGDVVYGVDVNSLEETIVRGLIAKKLTVATAESCTGGLISKSLTDIDGASQCFIGGVVAYSNDVKINLLGVQASTIAQHGAVSFETAKEMACGAREKLGADIGISVTGVAGQGASESKPVGTIFVGISTKDGARAFRLLKTWGKRNSNRNTAAKSALDIIRREILGAGENKELYEAF